MKNKKNFKLFTLFLLCSFLTYSLIATFLSWKADAVEDTTPPVLVSFEFSTDTVNTDSDDVVVNITAVITDDITGVKTSDTNLVMIPENAFDRGINHTVNFYFEHVSGNTYEGTGTFPKSIAKGSWHVNDFRIYDNIGNIRFYTKTDIEAISGVGSATIFNEANTEDITPPVLVEFELLDTTVNTEAGPDTARVRAKITDDETGVGPNSHISFRNGSKGVSCSFQEVIGEEDEYECEMTFPWGTAIGYYEYDGLSVTDNLGNTKYYQIAEFLVIAGQENSRIFNAATREDSQGPVLQSFSVTPTVFDTSNGPVELVMEVRITDDLTGVSMDPYSNPMQASASPLIGTQSILFIDFERISGNALDGVYRATATAPQFSKVGIWEIQGVLAADNAGNHGCELSANITPDDFVLINSANANEVVIEEKWYLSDEKVMLTFQPGTIIRTVDGSPFAFYRMLSQFYDVGKQGGFGNVLNTINNQAAVANATTSGVFQKLFACNEGENCVETEITTEGFKGLAVGLLRAGIPGLGMTFSKPVEIEVKDLHELEGQELFIQTFHEGGDEWIDETSCIVKEVEYFRTGERGGGELPDGTFLDPENPPRAVSCIFFIDHASFFGLSVLGASTNLPQTGAAIIGVVSLSLVLVLTYILSKKYMSKKQINAEILKK